MYDVWLHRPPLLCQCTRHLSVLHGDLILEMIPPHTGEDDWNVVVGECRFLAANWQQLSIYFGLHLSVIDRIKSDNPCNSSVCWSDALKQWIKQNYDTKKFGVPSWRTLLKAVAKEDKLQFKKLAAKHQGKMCVIAYSYMLV